MNNEHDASRCGRGDALAMAMGDSQRVAELRAQQRYSHLPMRHRGRAMQRTLDMVDAARNVLEHKVDLTTAKEARNLCIFAPRKVFVCVPELQAHRGGALGSQPPPHSLELHTIRPNTAAVQRVGHPRLVRGWQLHISWPPGGWRA